jgi:hypothetical protein
LCKVLLRAVMASEGSEPYNRGMETRWLDGVE